MPRVAGVDIPVDKRTVIALTYVFGIGRHIAGKILKEAGIDGNIRAKNLNEDQVSRINAIIDKGYAVEGSARRLISQNIARLKEIGSYRGLRHRKSLPLRGQRTKTNARTRKGPKKTVAGKKQQKRQG